MKILAYIMMTITLSLALLLFPFAWAFYLAARAADGCRLIIKDQCRERGTVLNKRKVDPVAYGGVEPWLEWEQQEERK
ncbi:hypothetical protein KGP36_03430 [Patescibacteria group bacterium]|nr:hypothetical protein [Patescibacteria group bacterium]